MAEDPIAGFGERIVKRARLPTAALLAVPLLLVGSRYFLFLQGRGFTIVNAMEQIKKDWAAFAFVVVVPGIILAFLRELQVHVWLDKMLGVRAKVDTKIVQLMRELATNAGYARPERITGNPRRTIEWFYSYVNEQPVTRSYAFEVWEGYYVGLYLSFACILSFLLCMGLLVAFSWKLVLPFLGLLAVLFLALWAVRRWSNVPKMMQIPVQQVQEIKASGEVLAEARRRFG